MAYFDPGTYTSISGGKADDILSGDAGRNVIAGNAGNDTLYGRRGDDFLLGNTGNDILYGNRGNDVLFGGRGNDLLVGGAGNDRMSGDFGADRLQGGTGKDIFYFDSRTAGRADDGTFTASDTILDFAVGDKIVFGNYTTSTTNILFQTSGANVQIFVDTNGDTTADYLAAIVNNASLADVTNATSFGVFLA